MKLVPLSYQVKTVDGELWRRHVDHIKQLQSTQSLEGREESSSPSIDSTDDDYDVDTSSTDDDPNSITDDFQTTESPSFAYTTNIVETSNEHTLSNDSSNKTETALDRFDSMLPHKRRSTSLLLSRDSNLRVCNDIGCLCITLNY